MFSISFKSFFWRQTHAIQSREITCIQEHVKSFKVTEEINKKTPHIHTLNSIITNLHIHTPFAYLHKLFMLTQFPSRSSFFVVVVVVFVVICVSSVYFYSLHQSIFKSISMGGKTYDRQRRGLLIHKIRFFWRLLNDKFVQTLMCSSVWVSLVQKLCKCTLIIYTITRHNVNDCKWVFRQQLTST